MDCFVKARMTRANVMTIPMAVAAKKSSKNHKLKPRSVKRDRTKLIDSKNKSKEMRAARG